MQQQQQNYTCPMHPEIVQDKPGDCPKVLMSVSTVILLYTLLNNSLIFFLS